MIKCCIFDLDGTLLSTLETIRFYVNRTLEKYGFSPISTEECRCFVGSGARVLMTRAFDSRGGISTELFEEALANYLADYDASPYHLTEKYDGIDELVAWLRDNGIKLAVLSNKQDISTCAAVKRFFGDAFDIVQGGREGIPLKPNPDGCYEILSELGCSPEECAYIGDSDVDARTGKNMGAHLNISALWGFRTKEELVAAGAVCFASSPRDIIKMIEACID